MYICCHPLYQTLKSPFKADQYLKHIDPNLPKKLHSADGFELCVHALSSLD